MPAVLSSSRFLARQECGIRGHDEANGDFFSYLLSFAVKMTPRKDIILHNYTMCIFVTKYDYSYQLQTWLRNKTECYITHESQNEMLKVMATTVPIKIASDLQGTEFCTFMIDEYTDAANLEYVYNIQCLTHKM